MSEHRTQGTSPAKCGEHVVYARGRSAPCPKKAKWIVTSGSATPMCGVHARWWRIHHPETVRPI